MAKASIRHWGFQALFRAFHFKEVELPEVWDFEVKEAVKYQGFDNDSLIRGKLFPFAFHAKLIASEEGWEKSAQRHAFLPVKIELVDVDAGYVLCRAAGPPKPGFHVFDPFRLQSG